MYCEQCEWGPTQLTKVTYRWSGIVSGENSDTVHVESVCEYCLGQLRHMADTHPQFVQEVTVHA